METIVEKLNIIIAYLARMTELMEEYEPDEDDDKGNDDEESDREYELR